MKRGLTLGAVLLALLALALPANAQETITFTYEIPQGTTVIELPAGSSFSFLTDVPGNAIGLTCSITDRADNNKSVHEGNDISVTSESGGVYLENVERGPGAVTEGVGTVTLGTTITTFIHLAEEPNWSNGNSIFSGVHTLTVSCEVPPPTTTTQPPPTTTTNPPPTTTQPPTTTTVPPTTTTEPPPTTTTTTPTTTTEPPEVVTTTTQAPKPKVAQETECVSRDDGRSYNVTWETVDGTRTRVLQEVEVLACTGGEDLNLAPWVGAGVLLLAAGLAALWPTGDEWTA